MAILGFTFSKLTAEKDREASIKEASQNIQVRYNIIIKNIAEEELKFQERQKVLRLDFEFSILYQPKIGTVELFGNLLYADSNMKKILDSWKKEKDITDNNLKAQIINAIFQKANLKAITLIQEVNLPLQFPLPKLIPPEQNPQNYIG